MASIQNKLNSVPLNRGIYSSRQKAGSKFVDEGGLFIMDKVAVGIRNFSGVDIVVEVIPCGNDELDTMIVPILDGSLWSDVSFNAIKIAGSTSHDSAKVYYLYE